MEIEKVLEFRWPKATSPPQEIDVWGPEGPISLVTNICKIGKEY
jgi:hypothetical protein